MTHWMNSWMKTINLYQGQEQYNAVDATSMRNDICYRDNNTKEEKHECDDRMLRELSSSGITN